jgi:hypothetical protein
MTDQHLITPPPELVEQWADASARTYRENGTYAQHEFALATQAAQWSADQELEACLEWLKGTSELGIDLELVKARRPKPPSLKEQALEALDRMDQFPTANDQHIIRRALESIND